jgi:anaerobic selenocysteine-containing dehydrogenase
VHNTTKYSLPAVEKEKGTKYDWEIFNGLVKAYNALLDEPKEVQEFTLEQTLQLALMSSSRGISLQQLKDQPHGIDLGPLVSKLPEGVLLDSKRMDILPEVYHQAAKKLIQTADKKATDGRLLLIGRRHLRSNNSWLHNSYRMVKGRDRCTALIHPDDAAKQNILNGETIEVRSRIGAVQIKAELTDEMMPGAISIPHGWGHHREGIQLDVAAAHAGVSINDIIDDELVDELCGVSVINATQVTIGKV